MVKFENKVKEVTKELNLKDLNKDTTLVVVVDMINGFIKEGALASKRVEGIIPEIDRINTLLDKAKKLFFVDEHEEDSKEFTAFPPHCLKGTSEAEIVDELKNHSNGAVIIGKNSTNGYMTEGFINYFNDNKDKIENIIVVGCCTDLCVSNFCLSTLTAVNQLDLGIDIIVPVNAVETYDLFEHEGDIINTLALYNMQLNGVKLCKFN